MRYDVLNKIRRLTMLAYGPEHRRVISLICDIRHRNFATFWRQDVISDGVVWSALETGQVVDEFHGSGKTGHNSVSHSKIIFSRE